MATRILQEIESLHVVPVQGTRDFNAGQHLSNHNLATRRPRWRIVWTWSARAAVHFCPLVAPVVSVGVNVTKKHPQDGKHDLFQGLAATTDHDAWTLSFCSLDDGKHVEQAMEIFESIYKVRSVHQERNEVLHCWWAYLVLYLVGCMFHGVAVSTEVELHHQRLRVVSPLSWRISFIWKARILMFQVMVDQSSVVSAEGLLQKSIEVSAAVYWTSFDVCKHQNSATRIHRNPGRWWPLRGSWRQHL